jgi:hypothetical protein
MMKRFDFAADVSKQLITISAAIITVLITFYEKFLSHREFVFFTIVTTLCLLIASIVCGIAALGGIVNLAERQERAGAPFYRPGRILSQSVHYVSAGGVWARASSIRSSCCV